MIRRPLLFIRLPPAERTALIESLALCTLAGVLIRVLPFRHLATRLGRHMAVSAAEPDATASWEVARIRWAIGAAQRHLPWHPVCLPRAIAAHWMLRRRGIPSTLYLGADPSRGYDAHAWVAAGDMIVTGGPREDRFAVVASFA